MRGVEAESMHVIEREDRCSREGANETSAQKKERHRMNTAIRNGLGGMILCLIALPYAVLMVIPMGLQWLLQPLARAAGLPETRTLGQEPVEETPETALLSSASKTFPRRHRENQLRFRNTSRRQITLVSPRLQRRVPHHCKPST